MKVFILSVLLIGSAAALGSGPYGPSGWRPSGPVFLLPTELERTEVAREQQDTESLGSEFLREYGPPKEVSQDITRQNLPEVLTEQNFVVLEGSVDAVKEALVEDVATESADVTTEEPALAQDITEAVTEIQNVVEETTQIQAVNIPEILNERSSGIPVIVLGEGTVRTDAEVKEKQELNEEVTQETSALEKSGQLVNEVSIVETVNAGEVSEENGVEVVQSVVTNLSEGVRNIADALISLENEAQVQQVSEIKTDEHSGSLLRAPVGFLEYGPPAFREYGPPKQEQGLRINVIEEQSPEAELVESNETRRRRYSPKFRVHSKHH